MKKFILMALLVLPMSLAAQQKFAHVNSADIIQALPEYTTAQTELQTLSKTYEDELRRMESELQTKSEDFEKNQATLPDAVKQRRQQELQEIYNRFTQYRQTASEELTKAQQNKMALISEKVGNAIKAVGTEGGYVYIMDVTSGIPFINETLSKDVTAEVKAKLGIK